MSIGSIGSTCMMDFSIGLRPHVLYINPYSTGGIYANATFSLATLRDQVAIAIKGLGGY